MVRKILPGIVKEKRVLTKSLLGIFAAILTLLTNVLPVFAVTFSGGMARRDAHGPFTAAPIVQGDWDSSGITDIVSFSPGNSINDSGSFKQNIDQSQGSIVFWITPEWNGNDGKQHAIIQNHEYGSNGIYKNTSNRLVFNFGWSLSVNVDISSWTAGTTYNVVARWDTKNALDGSSNLSLSINDSHTFGGSGYGEFGYTTTYIGTDHYSSDAYPANALIEGLTIYRRPLYDGTYGINVGNGDEINLIYNGGSGQDPTLVTGSWDIVFALPTNSSTGSLTTGTGEAWTHPHLSNLLYTNTTNTGGFMLNGTYSSDSWTPSGGLTSTDSTGTSLSFDGGDFVNVNDTNNTLDLSTSLTLSAWVKPNFDQTLGEPRSIIDKSNINTDTYRLMYQSAVNDFRFRIFPGGVGTNCDTQGLTWTSGTWHHVAATYNGSEMKIYWDGVLQNTCSVTGTVTTNDQPLLIGDFSDSTYDWNGGIEDVRIYSRTLLQSEIKDTMYKSTLSAAEQNGLVGWWKFNDGSGQTVTDSSGNSNSGTLGADSGTSTDDPTWSTSAPAPTLSALATGEKIYAGGYKYTSSAANEGIYIDETVTVGDDWVVRALANSDGTSTPKIELWDQTHNVPIATQSGTTTSTRAAPNTFIFTGEAPSAMTTLRVKLLNTASSGTTYWHQVEILANSVTNPSVESGSGNPWVPTDWASSQVDTGESQQETTNKHSGASSVYFHPAALGDWPTLYDQVITTTTGDYWSFGGWFDYVSGSPGLSFYQYLRSRLQDNASNEYAGFTVTSDTTSGFHNGVAYINNGVVNEGFQIRSNSDFSIYFDDLYLFELSAVSLTVTPASQANSTENTDEIRVDGRDTYTASSAEATSITTTTGYLSFNWRPRHAAADGVKFAETTSDDAYIVSLNGDSNDYIRVYWDSANTIAMSYNMNGTSASGTWDATGAIAANTEYAVVLSYTGSSTMTLSVGGTTRITLSSIPASFGTSPNNPVYFGSDTSSSNQGDATFSSIVFDNTAPSISLTALSPDPNNDTTPSLTGTTTEAIGTVSNVQYQMDSTSGSWSSCTADDSTFDEATEAFTCTAASALSNGSHTMYVRATDSNNNTTGSGSESSDTFTIDATAPSVSATALSPDPTTDTTPSVTGTVTDATTVLTDIEFQVDSTAGSWTNCTADDGGIDETSEAFTCTPSALSDGSHTIYVRATDSASNTTSQVNYGSDTFVIDSGAPTVSLTAISPDPGSDTTPAVSGTVTDTTGTISSVQYQVDSTSGTWTSCSSDDGSFDEASETFSCTASSALSDGSHTIYIRATDNSSNTSSNSSDSFTVDTTAPTSFDLDSPGTDAYTNSERPTFKWKGTSDTTSSLASYTLEVDNGDSGDFSVSSIPSSGTSDYETNKYTAHYDGFSDGDSTNNYVSVYTKSTNDWGSDNSDGKLKEGKRRWTVRIQDSVGNERTEARTLFVDKTAPSLSDVEVNGTTASEAVATTDIAPTFSGRVTDGLAGDKTDNKVASGPKEVEIKVEKKGNLGIYSTYLVSTVSLAKTYWVSDGKEISSNSQNTSDKYAQFSYKLTNNLPNGTFKVTISGKDTSGNSSSNSFYLTVGDLERVVTKEEEEKIERVIEEEMPGVSEEEKEVIKEELEVTKEIIPEGPNIVEKTVVAVGEVVSDAYFEVVGLAKNLVEFSSDTFSLVATTTLAVSENTGKVVREVTLVVVENTVSAFSSLGSVASDLVSSIPPLGTVTRELGKPVATISKNLAESKDIWSSTGKALANSVFNTTTNIVEPIAEGSKNVTYALQVGFGSFSDTLFDKEPTKIMEVRIEEVGKDFVVISWKTNHYSTGKVNYGETLSYGREVFDDRKGKIHQVRLTGLKPGSKYVFEVMSHGKNYTYDAYYTFETSSE